MITKPYETLALRIAVQLNLLHIIKDGEDVTALDLALTTGADRLVIGQCSHTVWGSLGFNEPDNLVFNASTYYEGPVCNERVRGKGRGSVRSRKSRSSFPC